MEDLDTRNPNLDDDYKALTRVLKVRVTGVGYAWQNTDLKLDFLLLLYNNPELLN